MLSGGVIAAAKHFPGHGDTAVDSHYGLPTVEKTVDELMEFELVPFRQAIEGTCVYGAAGGDSSIPVIMVAHILMSAIDPDRPASLSQAVVTGPAAGGAGLFRRGVHRRPDYGGSVRYLRHGGGGGTGYGGGLRSAAGVPRADNLTAARSALLEAVESGRITQARLDESVYRILKLKADFNLTNDPVEENVDVDGLNRQISALKEQLAGT